MSESDRKTPAVRAARLAVLTTAVILMTAIQLVPAAGQTVYRWRDEHGVLHFSQSPPPPGTAFQVRGMPTPQSLPTQVAEQTPAARGSPVAGTPTPKLEGEARVEIVSQSAQQLEPSVRLFRGTVKNAGGTAARDVVVIVDVTERQQGAECLHTEIEVTPSSLAPGETGTFEAEFENPCFFGDVSVRVQPDWD